MRHIAVLESDRQLAENMMAWLDQAGYRFTCCSEPREFAACLELYRFDLLLIDCDCLDPICLAFIEQALSCQSGPIPWLYVSQPDSEAGIVKALQYGADDYVVKPLSGEELLSRIDVLLRRFGQQRESLPQVQQFGLFRIDRSQRLIWRDEQLLVLTEKDFCLADYLFSHSNQLLSRRRLLAEVWGVSQQVNTRTVDMHISRLRKSLALPGSGYAIQTVHQHGYRLQHEPIAAAQCR